MYYDAEANKYGADYNQLDNTMAFSDVSIRAGRFILSVLNPKEIKIKIQCYFFLSALLNYASFSFVRLHTKGKLALLAFTESAEIEFQNSCFGTVEDVLVCVQLSKHKGNLLYYSISLGEYTDV